MLRRNKAVDAPGVFHVHADDTGSAATSWTDTDVEPGTFYVYRVKARNAAGLSPESSYFNARTPAAPQPPAQPTGLTGTVVHDRVELTWDDPGDDSITGYQILRRNKAVDDPGVFRAHVDDTGSAATSWADTDVEPGTFYVYRAKARNAAGLSECSSFFNADTPAYPSPEKPTPEQGRQRRSADVPDAPLLMGTAVSPDGDVILSWRQDPPDASITGYRILRGASEDALAEIVPDTGSAKTTYTDTGPPAGQTLRYAVQARSAAGLSEPSNTLSVTTPAAESEGEDDEDLETAESSHDTLVSNLDETDGTNADETPTAGRLGDTDSSLCVTFTTGASVGFILTHLEMDLQATSAAVDLAPSVELGDCSRRGAVLYRFELPSGTAFTSGFQRYTFTTEHQGLLQPNTTYQLRVGSREGAATIRDTASDDQDSDFGWTIGDEYLLDVQNLETFTLIKNTLTEVPKFRLRGREVTADDENLYGEPASLDFPGSSRDYAQTRGVVSLGQPSLGELSGNDVGCRDLRSREDRQDCYGTAGDLWRLDVPANRYYRVEVVFGDSPGVDTGGMVSIRVLRPGDDGLSGLGNAVDHNREDGRSFVHVKTDWRRYYVNVDAKDVNPDNPRRRSDNHLSLEYEGPYTITVTDITGVVEVTDNVFHVRPTANFSTAKLLDSADLDKQVDYAQQFTTGDHPAGYRLDRVEVQFHLISDSTTGPPTIRIEQDDSNAPSSNTALCSGVTGPRGPIREHTRVRGGAVIRPSGTDGPLPGTHTFHFAGCITKANSKLHIVFSDLKRDSFQLETTGQDGQDDPTGEGWSIADGLNMRVGDSASWESDTRSLRIKLWAAPR